MDENICPECGGIAIPRPECIGGGIFCGHCGVVKYQLSYNDIIECCEDDSR